MHASYLLDVCLIV